MARAFIGQWQQQCSSEKLLSWHGVFILGTWYLYLRALRLHTGEVCCKPTHHCSYPNNKEASKRANLRQRGWFQKPKFWTYTNSIFARFRIDQLQIYDPRLWQIRRRIWKMQAGKMSSPRGESSGFSANIKSNEKTFALTLVRISTLFCVKNECKGRLPMFTDVLGYTSCVWCRISSVFAPEGITTMKNMWTNVWSAIKKQRTNWLTF